jgi:nicotinamidase-related amidase
MAGRARNVLVIVDMITPWDFEGADEVATGAAGAVTAINRARTGGSMHVVHANDLHGGFHGSREKAFELAMAGRRPDLVAPLEPAPNEDFIHKGQHSAFYGTPLAHLLQLCEAEVIYLAGQVTEQCVLYTALDAHVRGYQVAVLTDAVLAKDEQLGAAALKMIESNMGGALMSSHELFAWG